MDSLRKNLTWVLLIVLFLAAVLIGYVLYRESNRGQLMVSFLNIGQGDAILVESPSGAQMMIDGGPGRVVLSEVGRVMPFYDRTIDVLLVTNPDKDHMAGFIDVLRSYKVKKIIEPGTKPTTAVYQAFEEAVVAEHAQKIIAKRGERIALDGETYFDILFPDRNAERLDTNTGSIVGKLVYKNVCIIFPGDAPEAVENYISLLDTENLRCEVLKAGHHGSRTSTGENFLQTVKPSLVVISAGKDNKYNHPHQEVLERLRKNNVRVLSTYNDGGITLVSDGNSFEIR